MVEFNFPWPVGSKWSRIEVRWEGNSAISWQQIDGSLETNEGRISITTRGQQTHLSYHAVISVGLPDARTHAYKKKFVSEFLNAVHDQAAKSDLRSTLARGE